MNQEHSQMPEIDKSRGHGAYSGSENETSMSLDIQNALLFKTGENLSSPFPIPPMQRMGILVVPETMPTSLAKHELIENVISEKFRINTGMSINGNWPSSLTSHT